jgi:hypothetical protein
LWEGNPISLVFQNIDPPSPSPPGEFVLPPATKAEGTHSPGGEGDGGSIFWKTREIGLPSYNDLSTANTIESVVLTPSKFKVKAQTIHSLSAGIVICFAHKNTKRLI